jgi:hypothetical protein
MQDITDYQASQIKSTTRGYKHLSDPNDDPEKQVKPKEKKLSGVTVNCLRRRKKR